MIMPSLNTTPKVRKPYFSDLEKQDIQSLFTNTPPLLDIQSLFTNTPPFFDVARALNLVVMNQTNVEAVEMLRL